MVRILIVDPLALLSPWIASMHRDVPGIELFDAHTHLGQNDPDGFKQTVAELLDGLRLAHARGAFVFPMHEPDGYRPANDMVLEAARGSDGLLVPFCRVNPHDSAIAEAERCLGNGFRGVKLHPRAEQFTLDHPDVDSLAAMLNERGLPMLIHAGRGIPALGAHAVELARRYPNARIILAHAGISDLSWIWRAAADLPNLFFDTAWFMPADLLSLFSLVPPGQILFASDSPYGSTAISAVIQIRLAAQAGLSADQLRSISSAQSLRLAAGQAPVPAGAAVGPRDVPPRLLLDRVATFLLLGTIVSFRGGDGSEMLGLAQLGCEVPDDYDEAPLFAAIKGLLDAYEAMTLQAPEDRRRLAFLMLATSVAKSPDVPLPAG